MRLAFYLANLGKKEEHKGEIEKLLTQMEKVLAAVIKRKDPDFSEHALMNYIVAGRIAFAIGDWARGERMMKFVIHEAEKTSMRVWQSAMSSLGAEYEKKEFKKREAEEMYMRCLQWTDLPFFGFQTLSHKICLLKARRGDVEGAIQFREETLEQANSRKDPLDDLSQALLWIDTATLYEEQGKWEEAWAYDDKVSSMVASKRIEFSALTRTELRHIYRRTGERLASSGEVPKAIDCYRTALECFPQKKCDCCYDFGKLATCNRLAELVDFYKKIGGKDVDEELMKTAESDAEGLRDQWAKMRDIALEALKDKRKKAMKSKKKKREKKEEEKREEERKIAEAKAKEEEEANKKKGNRKYLKKVKKASEVPAEEPKKEEPRAVLGECGICSFEMYEDEEAEEHDQNPKEEFKALSCDHKFHNTCLKTWHMGCEDRSWPLTCPCCRDKSLKTLFGRMKV